MKFIDYLSKFPREWQVRITRSDDGGKIVPL